MCLLPGTIVAHFLAFGLDTPPAQAAFLAVVTGFCTIILFVHLRHMNEQESVAEHLHTLGGVDSRDSLLGANQIQGCF